MSAVRWETARIMSTVELPGRPQSFGDFTVDRADERLIGPGGPVKIGNKAFQVLVQLIDNGLKFSEAPRPVTVRVSALEEGCLIEVADQGIGIAEEFRESIFESFEQVHKGNTRKYGGAGIGLSISRSLVRMHGGDMWVHSELGRGATFYVLVPHALGATSEIRRSA